MPLMLLINQNCHLKPSTDLMLHIELELGVVAPRSRIARKARCDNSRWARETCSQAIAKNNWLGGLGLAAVHDWTVTIPLDEVIETMVRVTPVNVNIYSCKVGDGLLRQFVGDKIYDCVAKRLSRLEIHWQVNKIIRTFQTCCFKDFQQRSASHAFGKLAKDHCCAVARIATYFGLLRLLLNGLSASWRQNPSCCWHRMRQKPRSCWSRWQRRWWHWQIVIVIITVASVGPTL